VRRRERSGFAHVLQVELDTGRKGFCVWGLRSQRLVEFVLSLSTDSEGGAGLGGDEPVSRAIDERFGFENELFLGRQLIGFNASDAILDPHPDGADPGVHEDLDVRLCLDAFTADQAEDVVRVGGIASQVLDADFIDGSGFSEGPGNGLSGAIGARDVDTKFPGGVSSEQGSVVDERGFRAGASGTNRGAYAGQSATDHDDIKSALGNHVSVVLS